MSFLETCSVCPLLNPRADSFGASGKLTMNRGVKIPLEVKKHIDFLQKGIFAEDTFKKECFSSKQREPERYQATRR